MLSNFVRILTRSIFYLKKLDLKPILSDQPKWVNLNNDIISFEGKKKVSWAMIDYRFFGSTDERRGVGF